MVLRVVPHAEVQTQRGVQGLLCEAGVAKVVERDGGGQQVCRRKTRVHFEAPLEELERRVRVLGIQGQGGSSRQEVRFHQGRNLSNQILRHG